MEKRNYPTLQKILDYAVAAAKADPRYADAEKDCIIDYHGVFPSEARTLLVTCCEFDAIAIVEYGTSEGIYGSIHLNGTWSNQPCVSNRVYSLKTLSDDKDAYMGMAVISNLIAYHVREFVGNNLRRFD